MEPVIGRMKARHRLAAAISKAARATASTPSSTTGYNFCRLLRARRSRPCHKGSLGLNRTFRELAMTPIFDGLRAQIARLEGFSPPRLARTCPTGWGAVDAALPGGGLLEGALHEILSPDPADGAAIGFAVRLLGGFLAARPGHAALWASCRADVFAPGLKAVGVDPGRVLRAICRSSDEIMFVLEEAIKSHAVKMVIGEIGEIDFSLSRRLQLAAAATGATLILLRPARYGAAPSAAATRWRAESCPGGWALTLFRCRSGRPGHWLMPSDVGKC